MLYFLFFPFVVKFCTSESFDPTKIKYCALHCSNHHLSVGCNCSIRDRRQEITNDLLEFRKFILKTHNEYRNKVARGDFAKENYPSATDMMVLNYDIELEYLARCFGLSRFTSRISRCDMTSYCKKWSPMQNIFGSATKQTELTFAKEAVAFWFGKMTQPVKSLRKHLLTEFRIIGEARVFARVIWSKAIRVGCARVWNPVLGYGTSKQWRMAIICNYAGPDENCGNRLQGKKLYDFGPPCTGCRPHKCNNRTADGQFEALCGQIYPIPSTFPVIKLHRSSRHGRLFDDIKRSITASPISCSPGRGRHVLFVVSLVLIRLVQVF